MFVHVPCFHSRCWAVQKLRIYSHAAVVKQVCQQGVIPSRSGWIGLSIGQLRCDLLQELKSNEDWFNLHISKTQFIILSITINNIKNLVPIVFHHTKHLTKRQTNGVTWCNPPQGGSPSRPQSLFQAICRSKARSFWLVVEFQPMWKNMRKSHWIIFLQGLGWKVQKKLSCQPPRCVLYLCLLYCISSAVKFHF